jgi:predicted RNase H-like nuclease (RuvC/YqgF family)
MSEDEKEDKKSVGYMWRIGSQSADGITTDITGNFNVGASDDEINATLDRFHNIFYRQRAKSTLADEENTLRKELSALEILRAGLAEAGKKENPNSRERQNFEAQKNQIQELEARISSREAGIESLKKLI